MKSSAKHLPKKHQTAMLNALKAVQPHAAKLPEHVALAVEVAIGLAETLAGKQTIVLPRPRSKKT